MANIRRITLAEAILQELLWLRSIDGAVYWGERFFQKPATGKYKLMKKLLTGRNRPEAVLHHVLI